MDENPYRSPRQTGNERPTSFWFMRAACWLGVALSLFTLMLDTFDLYVSNGTFTWQSRIMIACAGLWLLLAQAWCKRGLEKRDGFAIVVLGSGVLMAIFAVTSAYLASLATSVQ
jgi:hypothetical protein